MLKRLVCQLTISIMIKCHFQDYFLYLLTLKTLCISIFTTAHISIQQMLLIFYAKDATVHSILDLRRNYLRYSYNLQLAIIGYISRAQGKKFYSCFLCLYLIGERMDGSDRLQYVELMESIPVQTRKLINHREFRLATCAGITLYKIALTFIYNFRHVACTESHCCLVYYPSNLFN